MSHPLQPLKTALRRTLAALGRGPVSAGALAAFRRSDRAEDSCSVHMLVSSKTWHAGMLAAASLEHFTGRLWRFFIHEDGSVPAEARAEIVRLLPGSRFVSRPEAEERVAALLAAHPRCAANRSRHNLFLKFFDTLAFADRDRFLVLDSDVIFFRRPAEILDWVDGGLGTCLYNEDTREKFCIPRADIENALPVTLLPRFNSGLVLMQRAAMDLDRAEQLLATFERTAHAPQFFEQTLYALMASTNPGGGAPLPRTYNISWGYWREPGSICRHYVGDFKHDLLYIEGAPMLLAALLRGRLTGGGK